MKTKCSKHGVVHTNGGYPSCSQKKMVKIEVYVVVDKKGEINHIQSMFLGYNHGKPLAIYSKDDGLVFNQEILKAYEAKAILATITYSLPKTKKK